MKVPEGWKADHLGRYVEVLDKHRVPLSSTERAKRQGPYPYWGANGILDHIDDYLFDEPLLLMAEDGGYYDQASTRPICFLVDGKIWVNNHAHVIRVKRSASREWVYYWYVHRDITRYLNGGTRAKLNQADLLELPLLLPPLTEQRRIAEILGAWDEAIALVERRLAAARERKRGLAQRLLTGQVRFPGFTESWREVRLGEVYVETSERSGHAGQDKHPVLSVSRIHGIVPQESLFSRRIASADTSRYKVVARGDLVYDPMLLWEAAYGFVDTVDDGLVSPAYTTLRFRRNSGDPGFFRRVLGIHRLLEAYKVISQGTNKRRRKATAADFLALTTAAPAALSEQAAISETLQECDLEEQLLERKLAALQAQKKGLMQRLLTGEVRVRV